MLPSKARFSIPEEKQTLFLDSIELNATTPTEIEKTGKNCGDEIREKNR